MRHSTLSMTEVATQLRTSDGTKWRRWGITVLTTVSCHLSKETTSDARRTLKLSTTDRDYETTRYFYVGLPLCSVLYLTESPISSTRRSHSVSFTLRIERTSSQFIRFINASYISGLDGMANQGVSHTLPCWNGFNVLNRSTNIAHIRHCKVSHDFFIRIFWFGAAIHSRCTKQECLYLPDLQTCRKISFPHVKAQQQYEQTMWQPVSCKWTTEVAHGELTKPKVVLKTGRVIKPINQLGRRSSPWERCSLFTDGQEENLMRQLKVVSIKHYLCVYTPESCPVF